MMPKIDLKIDKRRLHDNIQKLARAMNPESQEVSEVVKAFISAVAQIEANDTSGSIPPGGAVRIMGRLFNELAEALTIES